MKLHEKMQKWVPNGVILKVRIFDVFGFFSFMEARRRAEFLSYINLMGDYLHIEGFGPTGPRKKVLALQSRFVKMARKWPYLSRISTKSQNFKTCKFVSHPLTLAVPAEIMPDHPGKCQE